MDHWDRRRPFSWDSLPRERPPSACRQWERNAVRSKCLRAYFPVVQKEGKIIIENESEHGIVSDRKGKEEEEEEVFSLHSLTPFST